MTERVFAFMATVENETIVFAGINSGDTGVKDYFMAPEKYKILENGPISNGVHILRNVGITEITNLDIKAQAVALCIDDSIYIAYVDDLGDRSAFGVIRKLDKFDGNQDIQFKGDFFEKEVKVIHKTEGSQYLYEITDFESGDLILQIGCDYNNEWITNPIFKFKWIS